MTALEQPALRQLARRVLAHHAGSAAGAEALAAAAHRAYGDLARVSTPLIGQAGVDALTGRALHIAQREFPWLVPAREGTTARPERTLGILSTEQADGTFAQVIVSLERQDAALATEAAGALFAALTGLLVTFIGEPLTEGLLRKAWPDAFSDLRTEET